MRPIVNGPRARRGQRVAGARSVAVAGVAGTAGFLALAGLGLAQPGPCLAASVGVAVLTVWLTTRAAGAAPGAEAEARPPVASEPAPDGPYEEMLETLADPVLLIEATAPGDPNAHRFVFANRAARELLRLRRREGPLTTALRAPEVLRAVDEALFGRIIGEATYESGGVQGRPWRARAAPLTGDGRPTAMLTLRDETDIRRGERTRADFLANASHELRTPLASLTGFIETLRGHARDDPGARERFLAIMHDQAERMRRLIDDLMSLSRIELGEHIPPSDEIDLAAAARDVLDALEPLAAERGARFSLMIPAAGEAVVTGDRDQIVQVLQNLAENALKYTPRGGLVSVEVIAVFDHAARLASRPPDRGHFSILVPDIGPDRRHAAVRISDAGPGIAREHLPRLTERFYRIEGQKNGERTGAGLGLAIVKHIMNRHRGGLAVESAEGAGSTFTVVFPGRADAPGDGARTAP